MNIKKLYAFEAVNIRKSSDICNNTYILYLERNQPIKLMNIDRKRFPIIQQVQNGKLDLPMTRHQLSFYAPFLSTAESIVKQKPAIDYLCQSQVKAVMNVSIENPMYSAQGIVLVGDMSFLYKMQADNESSGKMDVYVYEGSTLVSYAEGYLHGTELAIHPCSHKYTTQEVICDFNFIYHFIKFKRYVQIKDKTLSTKTSRSCQTPVGMVKTDFKYPVHVISESYYTNIVRNEPFKVSGHKRHYKSGKVVEIAPFVKSGYNRGAGKLPLAA